MRLNPVGDCPQQAPHEVLVTGTDKLAALRLGATQPQWRPARESFLLSVHEFRSNNLVA
jgi:hypothetical protein